jgi:putative membrane protein
LNQPSKPIKERNQIRDSLYPVFLGDPGLHPVMRRRNRGARAPTPAAAATTEPLMLLWLKAIHIIAVIAWMAGMLYLPRLFVYHVAAPKGSPMSETFKVMERRLLKAIINPSMLVVFVSGPLLAYVAGYWASPWLQLKVVLALGLGAAHGYLARCVKTFARDANTRPAVFFRVLNEVPTALMILIVLLVVLKPF